MTRLRVGVLISGRGSNMVSLADACEAPDFPAQIACVLSNDPEAKGLEIAAARGIPVQGISHREFPRNREAHEGAMDAALRAHNVALVCLAGYMRLLTPWFVERWRNRMINIHPSILPAYKGLDTHARAIADGTLWHGCSVHFVRAEMDDGPIIAQAAVPVMPDDTPDRLSARVLKAEHQLYPEALRSVADGAVRVNGEKIVRDAFPEPQSAFNPPIRGHA